MAQNHRPRSIVHGLPSVYTLRTTHDVPRILSHPSPYGILPPYEGQKHTRIVIRSTFDSDSPGLAPYAGTCPSQACFARNPAYPCACLPPGAPTNIHAHPICHALPHGHAYPHSHATPHSHVPTHANVHPAPHTHAHVVPHSFRHATPFPHSDAHTDTNGYTNARPHTRAHP